MICLTTPFSSSDYKVLSNVKLMINELETLKGGVVETTKDLRMAVLQAVV
jgi:hypothetical protein